MTTKETSDELRRRARVLIDAADELDTPSEMGTLVREELKCVFCGEETHPLTSIQTDDGRWFHRHCKAKTPDDLGTVITTNPPKSIPSVNEMKRMEVRDGGTVLL